MSEKIGKYLGILKKIEYSGKHTLVLNYYENSIEGVCRVAGDPMELEVEVMYRVSPGKPMPELTSLRRLLSTMAKDPTTVEEYASDLASVLVSEGVDLLSVKVYADSDVHGLVEVRVVK